MNRICKTCNIEKDISEFYRHKRSKDGFEIHCKKCHPVLKRRRAEKKANKIPLRDGYYICRECNKEKIAHEFPKNKSNPIKKIGSTCKVCVAKYQKVYREVNKERHKELIYKYRKENKQKILQKQKEYYESEIGKNKHQAYLNRPEIKERNKKQSLKYRSCEKNIIKRRERAKKPENWTKALQYEKERYHNDPVFKLAKSLRKRLRGAILRQENFKNNYKYGSAVKSLGCTIDEFKIYFQSLFTEGMTWQLYLEGKIHADHIRPLCSFDLTNPEQLKQACHYTNIQPLWAIDNLRKSGKYEQS